MQSLIFTPAGCFQDVHLVPIRRGMGLGVRLDAITPALRVGDPVAEYHRGMGRDSRRFWFARVARVEDYLAHLSFVCRVSVTLPHTAWRRSLDAAPADVVA